MNNEGKVFLCHRKSEKSQGGSWEFPNGKVEPGESYEDCLKRELLEELDMEVQVKEHFKTVHYDYETCQVELMAFNCKLQKYSHKMIDHDLYEWVYPTHLLEYELAPADIPIAIDLGGIKMSDKLDSKKIYSANRLFESSAKN